MHTSYQGGLTVLQLGSLFKAEVDEHMKSATLEVLYLLHVLLIETSDLDSPCAGLHGQGQVPSQGQLLRLLTRVWGQGLKK